MSKAYVPNREADQVIIFAGPCSVESTEQFDIVAEGLSKMGLSWIRGGAFKPRTSPYSFQGLGIEGVKIMEDAGKKHGLKTITEVVDTWSRCSSMSTASRSARATWRTSSS